MSKCPYSCTNGTVFMEARGRVACPHCRNISVVLETEGEDGSSLFDKLAIPEAYKGIGLSGQELFTSQQIVNSFSTSSIQEVSNILERINKDLYNGKVTSLSCYIYTSNIVDSKRFVYGAQKMAVEKGLGVTPFISANTLYGLQRVGEYTLRSLKELNNKKSELKDINPDYIHAVDGYRVVQATDLTYFDFIHADVCFIEATAHTTEKGWTGLADLLGERSKRGLPTFVIGYWGARASGSGKGLRFLLAPEVGTARLDLLVPYELKGRKAGQKEELGVNRSENLGTTKSTISAGLSLNSFMEN